MLGLSVVVATRNRADLLPDLMASLRPQLGAGAIDEVVFVDNGSTDATPRILERFAAESPAVRVVPEPDPGLSRSRNTGTEAAGGAIVAYLDDDARPRPGWAAAMRAAFADETVVGAGGRIYLAWPGGREPRWMSEHLASLFSGLDLGEGTQELNEAIYPVGANMAVRRSAWVAVGGFSTSISRIGHTHISGDEKELFDRILDLEPGRLVYVGEAAVDHLVTKERATISFVLRRSFGNGQTRSLLESHRTSRPTKLHGELAGLLTRPKSTASQLLEARNFPALAVYGCSRLLTISGYLRTVSFSHASATAESAWVRALM